MPSFQYYTKPTLAKLAQFDTYIDANAQLGKAQRSLATLYVNNMAHAEAEDDQFELADEALWQAYFKEQEVKGSNEILKILRMHKHFLRVADLKKEKRRLQEIKQYNTTLLEFHLQEILKPEPELLETKSELISHLDNIRKKEPKTYGNYSVEGERHFSLYWSPSYQVNTNNKNRFSNHLILMSVDYLKKELTSYHKNKSIFRHIFGDSSDIIKLTKFIEQNPGKGGKYTANEMAKFHKIEFHQQTVAGELAHDVFLNIESQNPNIAIKVGFVKGQFAQWQRGRLASAWRYLFGEQQDMAKLRQLVNTLGDDPQRNLTSEELYHLAKLTIHRQTKSGELSDAIFSRLESKFNKGSFLSSFKNLGPSLSTQAVFDAMQTNLYAADKIGEYLPVLHCCYDVNPSDIPIALAKPLYLPTVVEALDHLLEDDKQPFVRKFKAHIVKLEPGAAVELRNKIEQAILQNPEHAYNLQIVWNHLARNGDAIQHIDEYCNNPSKAQITAKSILKRSSTTTADSKGTAPQKRGSVSELGIFAESPTTDTETATETETPSPSVGATGSRPYINS